MTPTKHVELDFNNLGIAPNLLAILAKNNYVRPTPIQHQGIPAILSGKDVVGIAQTGTGKTLAFGLPMIQRLFQENGQGLILVPTRDLALQVEEVLQKIGGSFGLKTAVVIGGASADRQIRQLRRNPHVVIATPGRLIDHLQQRNYSMNSVKIIVLDEADRMFDIGFMPQIKQILAQAPRERQTMLFSATMPPAITAVAAQHMKMPFRIEVAPSGKAADNVEQEIFFVNKEAKMQLLEKVLKENQGTTLIFSRTKHGAKKITTSLCNMGYRAAEIHSNRSLAQRRDALDGFKSGKYQVLVATDIASRGIDVIGIGLVLNFDLPENSEDYVHRIGRTGRADMSGKAISFATPDQHGNIKQIERLIRKTLPITSLPGTLPARRVSVPSGYDRRPSAWASRSFASSGYGRQEFRGPRRNPGDYDRRRGKTRDSDFGSRAESSSSFNGSKPFKKRFAGKLSRFAVKGRVHSRYPGQR